MKRKSDAGLYFLLIVFAAFSMVYYIAGALALREEFFHASRYARQPFSFGDDGQTLQDLEKEATAAGLSNSDVLLALNGVAFTGYAQIHNLLGSTKPGEIIRVSVRTASGKLREMPIRLAPREGADWPLGGLIAFLAPTLGVPLLGLLIGHWVVAARPRDLNAWLVLLLLAFPETAYGNLDWSFWPSPWYLVLFVWYLLVQTFVFPALLWFWLPVSRALENRPSLALVQVRHPDSNLRRFCFTTWVFCGEILLCRRHPLPGTPAILDPSRGLVARCDLSASFPRRGFR
jgi:phosphoserine phosphatase RsbU/P